jgi:tetratricopeptide (TPR) repeat protein
MKRGVIRLVLAGCILMAVPPAVRAQGGEAPVDESALIAYLKGIYLESENELAEAYQYYLYAEAREPDNARILMRVAKVAIEVGDLDRAKRNAEMLIERGAYVVEARILLAEAEDRLGNRERALSVLKELRGAEDVSQVQVLSFLAQIYRELERPEDAAAALEEASQLPDADFSVFYDLGILYAQAGKGEKAVQAMRTSVEMNPDFPKARLALAHLLVQAGQRKEAERSYRETLRLDPGNRTALQELADLYYESAEYDEGVDLLEPLYRRGALDEATEIAYGRFLYKAGKADEALSVFEALVGKMGEKPPLLRVIAEIEIGKGHLKTGLERLKRLVSIEPGRFDNYIGILLMLSGSVPDPSGPDEAVSLTGEERRTYVDEAASTVGPDSEQNNYIMGSVLRKMGEPDRAEPFLLRAEKIDPANRTTLLELAALYDGWGRYDEALKRVIVLYDKNREDASLANFYGYLLAEKGAELDRAEELLRKALAAEPENGYFLDSLGWIRFKEGRFREALDILLKAADKATDDAVIWEHIGDTYVKLNETSHAREAYRKSLAIDPKAEKVSEKMRKLGGGE